MKRIVFIILFFPFCANAQIITTYAGNGTLGSAGDGGQATNANLNKPFWVYIDRNDDLLICHSEFIRKINISTGIISTIAGDTSSSAIVGDGGAATATFIDFPFSVCAAPIGNLYVADNFASEVRKINIATGMVSDYAGIYNTTGNSGDGEHATSAKVGSPFCVCIDTVRNSLYISDEYNYSIRKVDMLTGIITTFAGTGISGFNGDGIPATNAELGRTLGISIDRSGNLYIGDWDNERIRKVDISTGLISTYVGNGTSGFFGDGEPATNASLSEPGGLCFDSCGNLYFSDGPFGGNYRIRRIDVNTEIITTIAGNGSTGFSGDGEPATSAMLSYTYGICFDKNDNLYIADIENERVRKVTFPIGCDGSSLQINNINPNPSITIYPNPTHDELTITASSPIVTITISNLLGQSIPCPPLPPTGGAGRVDVSGLPAGVYVVRVTDKAGEVVIRKVVKE